MARIRINTRNHTKEKPYLINSYFFKIGKAKKSIGWAKYMYVCEWDMCWRNFCNFPLVTKKNVKSRSKIAFFFQRTPYWNLIFKKENNYVFLKKRPAILHVTTSFSLKTRTSSGLIPPPPLKCLGLWHRVVKSWKFYQIWLAMLAVVIWVAYTLQYEVCWICSSLFLIDELAKY